ncbi:uncharacterized protein LOC109810276 [Cajanus cajan]|uniref:uncharacterized protein LOC109810276 n=1 Tax=Cajanus cajan TaxID=3821 RepID=UPI00098D7884|nr:uncharacterized protein LOC109810276 [Cajanus cajan]
MALVKVAFVVVVLASIASNGLGFTSIARKTGSGECVEDVECNSIIPYCKEIAICGNGVCMCDQIKEIVIPKCRTDADCGILLCFPPCNLVPYCDIKSGVCKWK